MREILRIKYNIHVLFDNRPSDLYIKRQGDIGERERERGTQSPETRGEERKFLSFFNVENKLRRK